MMSAVLIARLGQAVTTVARHAVPLGGLFGLDWHPAVALVVYWLESVLLVLGTAGLCALMARRTRDSEVDKAGIRPRDVLLFHLGSLFVFGGFLGGVLVILIGNGHVDGPIDVAQLREGALAMLAVVVAGVLIDLWRFDDFTVDDIRARVDGCLARWGLFWMLGFFGTILMAVSGRPAMFLGFFGVLKVMFETWGKVARALGWRSVKERPTQAAR